MTSIEPLINASPPALLDAARALLCAYAGFLRHSGGHQSFRFDRLEEEIADLPSPYTSRNGEFLIAHHNSLLIGCIAYRAFRAAVDPDCCEIKRLFVAPDCRARGIGKRLVAAALERAKARGYRTACLDTEPTTMPAAHRLYLNAGFREYLGSNPGGVSSLIFLRKSLA